MPKMPELPEIPNPFGGLFGGDKKDRAVADLDK